MIISIHEILSYIYLCLVNKTLFLHVDILIYIRAEGILMELWIELVIFHLFLLLLPILKLEPENVFEIETRIALFGI